jgi:hypothetical protein
VGNRSRRGDATWMRNKRSSTRYVVILYKILVVTFQMLTLSLIFVQALHSTRTVLLSR